MKVLVPLNNIDHIDDYIKAGAGEFYIGFYDEYWTEKFGEYADINRLTGFKKSANPYDLEEVIKIIHKVRERDILIYVTFNASVYSDEQIEAIKDYMYRLKETDVSGVIVSCIELALVAKEIGLQVVISTISGVYNEDIVTFYKGVGAKRVILPRDLSVKEIQHIMHKVPDIEYEVFLMRNGCRFSDGQCLGFHRSEKSAICSCLSQSYIDLKVGDRDFEKRHEVELNNIIYTRSFHNNACGLCALYQFVKLGVNAGKIVGRSDEWQYVCRDIELMRKNIELAKRCETEKEYLDKMYFPDNRVIMCKLGLSCYYPEIRF